MLIAALFTIARAWKQPRCPSADEWIKSCGTYTQWNITQPTKEHIWVSSSKVDEPRAYYTEWSKSERERQILYINEYLESTKMAPTIPCQFSSVQFSSSVMSNSLQPQGLHHTRLPSPSPTPRAYSNSCPSSRWCHPSVSSSVIPFSSRFQSFPASGSFQMSQFFTSGGQSRCKAAKEKQM